MSLVVLKPSRTWDRLNSLCWGKYASITHAALRRKYLLLADTIHMIRHVEGILSARAAVSCARRQGDVWSLGCALYKWTTGKEFAYLAAGARLQDTLNLVPSSCGDKVRKILLILCYIVNDQQQRN